MRNAFEILLSDENIVSAEKPSVYVETPICVRLGDTFFPDPAWSDLALSVLSMWAENLLQIHAGLNGSCKLCFLDGPYSMEVSQTGDDLCITAISSLNRRKTEAFSHCKRGDMIRELVRAFSRLDYLISQHDAASPLVRDTVHNTVEHYRTRLKNETADKRCLSLQTES